MSVLGITTFVTVTVVERESAGFTLDVAVIVSTVPDGSAPLTDKRPAELILVVG
jgi:hypothetical protein